MNRDQVQTVLWRLLYIGVPVAFAALLVFGDVGPDEPVLTPPAPPCRSVSPGVCPAVTP